MNNSNPPENLTWYRIKFITSLCWSMAANTLWKIGPFGMLVIAGAEILLWASFYLVMFSIKEYYRPAGIAVHCDCNVFALAALVLTNVSVIIPIKLIK